MTVEQLTRCFNTVRLRAQRLHVWPGLIAAIGASWSFTLVDIRPVQGYSFQGLKAPQILPNPLVSDQQQQLVELSSRLRNRSVRVTLTEALEQSLLNNPELSQSYSLIQGAQWSLIAVKRQWYPSLSATGGLLDYAGRNVASSATPPFSDKFTAEQIKTINPTLSLNWSFFDLSRGPKINALNEALRSKELLFNVAARNLTLQTQISYFTLQEQLQLLQSYQQNLETTVLQVSQAEALYNAGSASIADVEQIRTQQYQTLELLISTHRAVIESSSLLAKAMSLPPGQLALPADHLALYGEWILSLDATVKQALKLREEIQSSLALATSAGWNASSQLNQYFPTFFLKATGSYNLLKNNSSILDRLTALSSPSTVSSSTLSGSVGLGFAWNIFDGGIAAANAEASKAIQRDAVSQSMLQRLQVTQEVESAYANYETSRLSLLSTREQVKSSQLALQAIRARFNVGYADTTSVVQALNVANVAANAYASAQKQYNIAVASLYRASAQWPASTLELRNKRVDDLKKL